MDILDQLNGVFRDVLGNDEVTVTRESSADDVKEWDSLTHIQLVAAAEKHFKVKFQAREIRNWKNVGEMCDAISQKLNRP